MSRLLPWRSGGVAGALVVLDGGLDDGGASLGKVRDFARVSPPLAPRMEPRSSFNSLCLSPSACLHAQPPPLPGTTPRVRHQSPQHFHPSEFQVRVILLWFAPSCSLTSVLLCSEISRRVATTANCSLEPSASIMEPFTLIRLYMTCDVLHLTCSV